MDANTSNKGANLEGASIVLPLKSFQKAPDAGFRLARIIAKKSKDGAKELDESKGVIVPDSLSVSDANKMPALSAVLKAALVDVQDRMIRAAVISGSETIQHNDISLAKLEVFAAAENQSVGRLTVEEIKSFFEAARETVLALYAAERNLQEVSEEQARKVCAAYLGLFQTLTAAKPSFSQAKHKERLQMIAENVESDYSGKILAKIAAAEVIDDDAL